MTRSENEVAALLGKAARGAGVPALQAAQFGLAGARHLAAGRGAEDLERALGAPQMEILRFPLLLREAMFAAFKGPVSVCDADQLRLLQSYVETLPCACEVVDVTVDALKFIADVHTPAPRNAPQRITMSPEFVRKLQALSELTFVPESDGSRAGGAGAGLLDND